MEDGIVIERNKELPVWEGKDWRVTDENGKTYALPDSDLRRTYEPVDDAAKEMLARPMPTRPAVPVEKVDLRGSVFARVIQAGGSAAFRARMILRPLK